MVKSSLMVKQRCERACRRIRDDVTTLLRFGKCTQRIFSYCDPEKPLLTFAQKIPRSRAKGMRTDLTRDDCIPVTGFGVVVFYQNSSHVPWGMTKRL